MNGTKYLVVTALVLAAMACGKKDGAGAPAQDSTGRDLSLAPVDSSAALNDVPKPADSTKAEVPASAPALAPPPPPPPAPRPKPSTPPPKSNPPVTRPAPTPAPPPPATPAPTPPAAPAKHEAAAGSSVALSAGVAFGTNTHKVGQAIKAIVSADVTDAAGNVVIPAGSIVTLVITELSVSENKSDEGKVSLKATEVTIGSDRFDLDAVSTSVVHTLKGRGVKAGDVAKVGAGAAAGAILGRVLGGKGKGAIVGGVIGAAAGTAVAVNSADRDVIVAAGAKILIKLRSALTR